MAVKKKIEPDERYHDTVLLLKKYRDVVWSLAVAVEQAKSDFRECFGGTIEEFLDSVYIAGADLTGTDIEERAKSIERSDKMLKLIDGAVETMKSKNKYGKLYYDLLYYSYLSPNQLKSDDEVIEILIEHGLAMSRRTFYIKRKEAIECLGTILWGFTSKDCINVLSRFIAE